MSYSQAFEKLEVTPDKEAGDVMWRLADLAWQTMAEVEATNGSNYQGLVLLEEGLEGDRTHPPTVRRFVTVPETFSEEDYGRNRSILSLTYAGEAPKQKPVQVSTLGTAIRKLDYDPFHLRYIDELDIDIKFPGQKRVSVSFPANHSLHTLEILSKSQYQHLGHAIHRIYQSVEAIENIRAGQNTHQALRPLMGGS